MLIGPILVLTVLHPVNTSENNTYDIIGNFDRRYNIGKT